MPAMARYPGAKADQHHQQAEPAADFHRSSVADERARRAGGIGAKRGANEESHSEQQDKHTASERRAGEFRGEQGAVFSY